MNMLGMSGFVAMGMMAFVFSLYCVAAIYELKKRIKKLEDEKGSADR